MKRGLLEVSFMKTNRVFTRALRSASRFFVNRKNDNNIKRKPNLGKERFNLAAGKIGKIIVWKYKAESKKARAYRSFCDGKNTHLISEKSKVVWDRFFKSNSGRGFEVVSWNFLFPLKHPLPTPTVRPLCPKGHLINPSFSFFAKIHRQYFTANY